MGAVRCSACGSSVPTPNKGDRVMLYASGQGKLVNEQIHEDYIQKFGSGPFEVLSDNDSSVGLGYPGSTYVIMTIPSSWVTAEK